MFTRDSLRKNVFRARVYLREICSRTSLRCFCVCVCASLCDKLNKNFWCLLLQFECFEGVAALCPTPLLEIQCRSHGFPDLVLWRPKGHAGGGEPEKGWSGQEFGLGWDGKGKGWDVQVVEVKSPTDTLSHSQRAWISLLRDAGVPATVSRVLHC